MSALPSAPLRENISRRKKTTNRFFLSINLICNNINTSATKYCKTTLNELQMLPTIDNSGNITLCRKPLFRMADMAHFFIYRIFADHLAHMESSVLWH